MSDPVTSQPYPAVLTIAGSDCSGGAGVQADLKTFTSLQCYGTSVITSLTAQNTMGVRAVHAVPPEFVEQQIDAVLEDTPIKAIKTGMLCNGEIIRAVVRALKRHYGDGLQDMPPLILDPVMISTSGHKLLDEDGISALQCELLPHATLVTPNRAETEAMLRLDGSSEYASADANIDTVDKMQGAAIELVSCSQTSNGRQAVLIKGGHIADSARDMTKYQCIPEDMLILEPTEGQAQEMIVDVLYDPTKPIQMAYFARPRVDSTSTHGTGCTLSSAIASYIALGHELGKAVELATAYTHRGITFAFPMGRGAGPLNHMHSLSTRLIPKPSPLCCNPFTTYLIKSNSVIWNDFVKHPFTVQLGQGKLSSKKFVHFLVQDYHYLKYYARAYALLAGKSHSFPQIEAATRVIMNVISELSTHRAFCSQFGLSDENIETTSETLATMAYGCYLIDIGMQGSFVLLHIASTLKLTCLFPLTGDATSLLMALLACLLGYGEVGLWLKKKALKNEDGFKLEENPYRRWIEDYSGESYQSAVKIGLETIENVVDADPPSALRLETWRRIWDKCTWLERNFWDSAMDESNE